MKSFFFAFLVIVGTTAIGQNQDVLSAFDFWVGEWDATWTDANGNKVVGHNSITKELDNSVIREMFSDPSSGFLGTSISVFSTADSLWHQAWADNSGGYIDLLGVISDNQRVFQTKPVQSGEKIIIRRMVFYEIRDDSFTWDWEISEDEGKTWKLSWRIKYSRSK